MAIYHTIGDKDGTPLLNVDHWRGNTRQAFEFARNGARELLREQPHLAPLTVISCVSVICTVVSSPDG